MKARTWATLGKVAGPGGYLLGCSTEGDPGVLQRRLAAHLASLLKPPSLRPRIVGEPLCEGEGSWKE